MPAGRASSPLKSPLKKSKSTVGGPSTGDYEHMLVDQQHQMQMIISEKEIEIERLKTTVMSLNTKCSVVDDHLEDVKNTNARLDESEQMRAGLQDHIVDAG